MIDFTELINAQRKNRGIVSGVRNRKLSEIVNKQSGIEEAKAKVQEIINNGSEKRKRGLLHDRVSS